MNARFPFPIGLLLLAACANPGAIHRKLVSEAAKGGAAASTVEAAKFVESRCLDTTTGRWVIELKDSDALVRQSAFPEIYANYRVLCAEVVVGRPIVVEARGPHVDGKYDQVYYVQPKVTILDASYTPLTDAAVESRFDQGEKSSEIYTRWEAKESRSHRVYVVVEAENRPEKWGTWTATFIVDSARGPIFHNAKVVPYPVGRVLVSIRQPNAIEVEKPATKKESAPKKSAAPKRDVATPPLMESAPE